MIGVRRRGFAFRGLRPRRTGPALPACGLVLLGAMLGACTGSPGDPGDPSGSGPASPGASDSRTPSATAEPVTLRLSVYGDPVLRAGYRRLAEAFTKEHPSVSVEVEMSQTAEQASTRLAEAASGGSPPDVFVASNERAPRLVAAGLVRPLDDLLEERGVAFGDGYQRLALEAFAADSALQCMPYDVSPLVVFYHRGMVPFTQLTEPEEDRVTPQTGWTWDQFARAARLASAEGVDGAYVEPRLKTLLALVRSAGDDLVDDPRGATSLTFSDDGARSALEEVLRVVRDPEVVPAPAKLARKDGLTRFKQGKVAMIVGSRALVPELREVQGIDFDVFPLPRLARPVTVADVTGYCLSPGTEHLAEAADFVTFATGREGASIMAETGAVVPAHLPTLNSAAFTQPAVQPESFGVFQQALSRSSTVPFVPGWTDLTATVNPELERLFYEPVLDLESMFPRIDAESQQVLSPGTR